MIIGEKVSRFRYPHSEYAAQTGAAQCVTSFEHAQMCSTAPRGVVDAWRGACGASVRSMWRTSVAQQNASQQHCRLLSNVPSASSATGAPPGAAAGARHVVTRLKPRSGWAAVPPIPKFLGLTGLVPFVVLSPPLLQAGAEALSAAPVTSPIASFLIHDLLPLAPALQLGYGTAIVSFLGAVHWGAAMQSRSGTTTKIMFERYIWSVLPALVVFPAAALGGSLGYTAVIGSLLVTFAIDAKFHWKGALPKWYIALRVPLTLGAVAAMSLTLWHVSYEEQAVLDYEHAVSEVPLTVESAHEAVTLR